MNTLRSLAVDIMFNTGADKLLQVDSAVDELKDNAIEAAGNMDTLSNSVETAGKKTDGFLGISKGFMALTGAGIALGGAINKVTGRADELNAGLRRVETQTGVSKDEMREWIISVTDATSDVDGYVASMEELVKMGVETKEEFQDILPVFDTFGTATNKDMTEGIKAMHAVLSALDIDMAESAEHIDTLTWLTMGTTVSMGDLGRTMRREQGNIRELRLTFDEIAVALSALEAEGIKGPRAVMAFQSAIQNAEGDIDQFWRGLGVTSEALEEQNQKLLESEGLTEELAAANAQSLTQWDQLKHKIDMAMWSIGDFLYPVRDLGPLLMALGPISAFVGKGIGALGKVFKFFRVGSLIPATTSVLSFSAALLANPITWVVIGITALIAAGIALWQNWDQVTAFLGEKWEWLTGLFGGLWESAKEWGKDLVSGLIGGIKELWGSAVDTVKGFASDIAGGFKSFFGISSPSKLMMEYGGNITEGLKIGMEDDIPDIPVPNVPDTPRGGGGGGNVTFNPQIEIHIHGDADGEDIKAKLEQYFPGLMNDFFEMLAIRTG